MTLAIWKYDLRVADEQIIRMPKDAVPIYVGSQAGEICVWVMVDPSEDQVDQVIRVYGTGTPFDGGLEQAHVGTVQIGPFVWHVFWAIAG
jgi:hypothetical protein